MTGHHTPREQRQPAQPADQAEDSADDITDQDADHIADDIGRRLDRTHYGQTLAARGIAVMTLDDNGEIVQWSPDPKPPKFDGT